MKITIAIVKYIFAVILALLVAVYLLINILTTTVLNETYILSKLEETNYYNKINENIKSLSLPSKQNGYCHGTSRTSATIRQLSPQNRKG